MMRHRGLVERLDRAIAATAQAKPAPASLLDEVARALQDAVATTARSLDGDTVATSKAGSSGAPPAAGLPQILQHPPSLPAATAVRIERSLGQMLAPAILASALAAVVLLLSASITDLSRLPGLGWLADKPRPRLIATAPPPLPLVTSFDAAPDALVPAQPLPLEPAPPLTAEDHALLEHCETMIARGDMSGARQELARAANSGSANARFALAETFDPNVLAAWGMRERIADVGAARTLYEQAQASGDARAARRLAALREDGPQLERVSPE